MTTYPVVVFSKAGSAEATCPGMWSYWLLRGSLMLWWDMFAESVGKLKQFYTVILWVHHPSVARFRTSRIRSRSPARLPPRAAPRVGAPCRSDPLAPPSEWGLRSARPSRCTLQRTLSRRYSGYPCSLLAIPIDSQRSSPHRGLTSLSAVTSHPTEVIPIAYHPY